MIDGTMKHVAEAKALKKQFTLTSTRFFTTFCCVSFLHMISREKKSNIKCHTETSESEEPLTFTFSALMFNYHSYVLIIMFNKRATRFNPSVKEEKP